MNEKQNSEADVHLGRTDNPSSKDGPESVVTEERHRVSSAKHRSRSAKSIWSRLTDPQAAVLAAVIAALVSLIAAGVSIWNTSYTKELANYNANLQYDKERYDKTIIAYDEAIKAIRHMKNKIQVVLVDKDMAVEDARKSLREASGKLDEAYENNGSAITASDYFLSRVFHDTKSSGRRAWSNLEGENEQTSSKLSAGGIRTLEEIVKELSLAEGKLQEKYNSLTVK